ncbi:transcriptional regulator, LysR family [Palleronia marisminoris]|uniref:HTH-type transcriptional regulator DmlR n=2 Tax=Palleronia marisminoris TaxID=315423 RepID=A0A1Y5RH53_9RHOB|nr:transcriptional regulator, LysR family [Palleronia marisminoris]SLN17271.1 HTH-type transcriptional regulator DmlR [Palleronia marisminoris]
MMDWDKLRVFHAVAEAGSLTAAGESLHLSQSAVSRQIRALEESLETVLFHRHARGLILTEQGELLHDATASMYRRLDTAAARIRDSRDEVFGELRVTTTTGFGTLWLVPRLAKLYEKFPNLKIDLMLEERVLDLPMREADVAIRMKEPSQADLVRKRLNTVRMRLYALPSYLEENGRPQTVEDLSTHRLISQAVTAHQVSSGLTLIESLHAVGIPSTLTVNNYFGVLQGVLSGLGIGVLPDYLVADFPHMERVLPDVESGSIPVYLAYPEELRHSQRIAAFREFVLEELSETARHLSAVEEGHARSA